MQFFRRSIAASGIFSVRDECDTISRFRIRWVTSVVCLQGWGSVWRAVTTGARHGGMARTAHSQPQHTCQQSGSVEHSQRQNGQVRCSEAGGSGTGNSLKGGAYNNKREYSREAVCVVDWKGESPAQATQGAKVGRSRWEPARPAGARAVRDKGNHRASRGAHLTVQGRVAGTRLGWW